MEVAEWGRGVLGEGLARLRPCLAPGLTFARCSFVRRGREWRVRLDCRRDGVDGAPGAWTGRGRAVVGPGWPPGDPVARRRVLMALAEAVAEVAVASGLGVAACRWPLRPALPCPRRVCRGGGVPAAGGSG